MRYRVASEASKRMDETLEAPEAVSVWSYVLAWSVVVALQLFFCYYLISTGSKFGLRKSRVWLSLTFLELATFFLVVKPLFVCFYYIVVPSLLGKTLTEAREARKRGRRGRALPYATELPMGATYYILERHPDLRETPAGIITRAEQEACPGATDARAFVHAIREIAPEPPSSALRHALLGIAAAFFFLHEEVQDIILEEIVAALPVCAGCAVRLIETLAKSEGLVEALALVAAALFCAVLYLLASCGVYVSHWCRDYWDPQARAVSRLRRVRAALGRLGSRLRSSFRIRRSSSSPRSDAEADLQGIEVKFPRTVPSPRLPAQ